MSAIFLPSLIFYLKFFVIYLDSQKVPSLCFSPTSQNPIGSSQKVPPLPRLPHTSPLAAPNVPTLILSPPHKNKKSQHVPSLFFSIRSYKFPFQLSTFSTPISHPHPSPLAALTKFPPKFLPIDLFLIRLSTSSLPLLDPPITLPPLHFKFFLPYFLPPYKIFSEIFPNLSFPNFPSLFVFPSLSLSPHIPFLQLSTRLICFLHIPLSPFFSNSLYLRPHFLSYFSSQPLNKLKEFSYEFLSLFFSTSSLPYSFIFLSISLNQYLFSPLSLSSLPLKKKGSFSFSCSSQHVPPSALKTTSSRLHLSEKFPPSEIR
ncbi:unnamed protein product [Acanthosepion pharaonis]|uniref:Uncharacterized protein n=1 Tax=Acanthosepion pharaonis TaxID=158019 RepID=A0A812CKH0_ACAPH|nr:unnamed protein product [Sepia pharaonis]